MNVKEIYIKRFEKFRNGFLPFFAIYFLGGMIYWTIRGYTDREAIIFHLIFGLSYWVISVYLIKRIVKFSFDNVKFTISMFMYKSVSSVVRYEKYILVKKKFNRTQYWLVLEVWMGKELFSFAEKFDGCDTDMQAFRIADPPVQFRCLKPGTIDEIAAMIDEFNRNRNT